MPKNPSVSTEEMLRRLSKGSGNDVAALEAMPDSFKKGEGIISIPDFEDKAAGFADAPKKEAEKKPMTQKAKNMAALDKAMELVRAATKGGSGSGNFGHGGRPGERGGSSSDGGPGADTGAGRGNTPERVASEGKKVFGDIDNTKKEFGASGEHVRDAIGGRATFPVQYSIKVQQITLPEGVEKAIDSGQFSREHVNGIVEREAEARVRDIMETAKQDYPTMNSIGQAGRSGGWIVADFKLNEADVKEVHDAAIKKDATHSDHQEWKGVKEAATKTLDDVAHLGSNIKEAVRNYKSDLQSVNFWQDNGVIERGYKNPRELKPIRGMDASSAQSEASYKSLDEITKDLEDSGNALELATQALESDPTSAQAREALDAAIEKHEKATNTAIQSLSVAKKTIGQDGEIQKGLREEGADIADAHMEICKVDISRRMVYGVFLWPAEADHDGDVISAADIEKVAHGFMKDYRDIDEMHGKEVIDASIVESAIAWSDDIEYHGQKLKKGAWFGAVYVANEDVWQKVRNGSYKGFSVRISGVREPVGEDFVMKSVKERGDDNA